MNRNHTKTAYKYKKRINKKRIGGALLSYF